MVSRETWMVTVWQRNAFSWIKMSEVSARIGCQVIPTYPKNPWSTHDAAVILPAAA